MLASSSPATARSRFRISTGSEAFRRARSRASRRRSFSSPAAFRVKVTAAIPSTRARPLARTATRRRTNSLVLPVPAAASTRRLPSREFRMARRPAESEGGGILRTELQGIVHGHFMGTVTFSSTWGQSCFQGVPGRRRHQKAAVQGISHGHGHSWGQGVFHGDSHVLNRDSHVQGVHQGVHGDAHAQGRFRICRIGSRGRLSLRPTRSSS